MKNSKWILRFIFILIVVISLLVVRNILEIKSPHGINQARAFYEQPKNTIDVLAMGSSHIHCGVNTAELWHKYGIASYDFSAAEQPLWMTYYYLKEAYKYQSPKVIVLDVFSPARFKEDYHYKWIEESIFGLRLSKNKIDMLDISVEADRKKEFFPDFFVYHTRYENLNKEDLYNIAGNHSGKQNFKGYTPGFNVADQSEPFGGWDELEDYHLTEKSEEYLRKIIELTKSHGSQLMVVVVPYNLDERDSTTYKEISSIVEENGENFIDFNDRMEDIGIDKAVDFNDHTHLNYWGSVKFTDYFGEIISTDYDVPDKRGEADYKSWDKNYETIISEANLH